VTNDVDLAQLDEHQLRELVRSMRTTIEADQTAIAYRDREIEFKQRLIDKITHEMAVLKRLKFAAQSERFTPEQRSLLEETIDADLAALDGELDKADADGKKEREKQQPKRKPLPPELPRTEFHHEPENTTCQCGCALKRIGEEVAEKLDYAPGIFSVERHVRGHLSESGRHDHDIW